MPPAVFAALSWGVFKWHLRRGSEATPWLQQLRNGESMCVLSAGVTTSSVSPERPCWTGWFVSPAGESIFV
jgi:hypothetical protein